MIYLSDEAQSIRESMLHVLFCISTFLNLVSLYCLIKQTPPNQAKIRNFLLFMQVCKILLYIFSLPSTSSISIIQIMVISIGIYTDLLMKPIPLFPALAGICTGFLCQIGLRPPTTMVCYFQLHSPIVIFMTVNEQFQLELRRGIEFGSIQMTTGAPHTTRLSHILFIFDPISATKLKQYYIFQGILVLLYIWLAAAIGFCIFFRHQTLLSENGKLSKVKANSKGLLATSAADLYLKLLPKRAG